MGRVEGKPIGEMVKCTDIARNVAPLLRGKEGVKGGLRYVLSVALRGWWLSLLKEAKRLNW